MKSILNNKILVTLGAFIVVSLLTLWEYFNGGVITHHLLADEDLPGISNWWGLVTIPLLSFLIISIIHKRQEKKSKSEAYAHEIVKRFLKGLIFGVLASLLWEFNLEHILQYFILLPILFAFFTPVHLPEYLLGFVIGMIYSFGGILPILIGVVLLTICFIIHKLIQVIKTVVTKSNTKN